MSCRATIFLYTEAAEIDDATRAAMIEHGYLPVKVADLDAVKFLVPPTAVSVAELSAVTEAVLLVIADNPGGIAAQELGPKLAELLLAARKSG